MAKCHDFENGDLVCFKPEHLQPGEGARQVYVVVNSHSESRAIDVKPIGSDLPYVPVNTYSHQCFMEIGGLG